MGVYSYHTFILPFVWEGSAYNHLTISEFTECFDNNPNWVCTDMKNENLINATEDILNKDELLLYYSEYQYFHPYVRKAMYGYGEGIVKNYSFMPQKIRNKGHYYIEKRFKVAGQIINRKYDLLINAIKLKVFNTGVALFILECENHGTDAEGKRQDNFDDVKNINDYGRRITLPFIPKKENDYISLCADKLSIEIDGVGTFVDDNLAYCQNINDCCEITTDISLAHICDFIKQILGHGSSKQFTSKPSSDSSKIHIYPALDDRMFVACCVIDKTVADSMTEKDGSSYKYLTDCSLQKQLYEYAFIDPGYDNCTCQCEAMRIDLLSKHTYTRWVEGGAIDCISAQSFVRLISDDAAFLYEPFLTQYVQMMCLCLADRTTLIHFQREASSLSANIEEQGKKIRRKTITALMNFQERYVAYQSQLSFSEVTSQEQGIELYNMLREFMFIENENEKLQSQIESLEDAAETNLDYSFNKIAVIFAVVSAILALAQNVIAFISAETGKLWAFNGTVGGLTFISMFALSAVTVLVIMLIYRRRK